MRWIKKGLIFKAEGQYDWVMTHGMLPVADRIGGDRYRIYFSGRDRLNRSSIGFVEIDIREPENILRLSETPALGLGSLGAFDDNGVTPTWVLNQNGTKYMYYFGWNKGSSVRAGEMAGLAISNDGGETFTRVSRAPILERTDREPYSILVACCIRIEDGLWRMWYDSADEWTDKDLPRYNIKYAESKDGFHWVREGTVSVDFQYPGETRVSRACVLKEGGRYRMWYCYALGRGGYRMGYGESSDGVKFERKDQEVGIDVSESGWDSEMICYPFVFNHGDRKYMLYCGNGYGRTGFGYAVGIEE